MAEKTKMENFTSAAVYFLLILAFVLFFGEKNWWPSIYDPHFYGWAFLTSAAFIFLPRLIFIARNQRQKETLTLLRACLAATLLLNAIGEVYFYQLYKYGLQYDKVTHFINSFLLFTALASFLISWRQFPLSKALMTSAALMFIGGFLWEFLEYGVDRLFNTKEFGIYGQYAAIDTVFDIFFDIAGIAIAFLIWREPKLACKFIGEACSPPPNGWPAENF